MIRKNSYGQVIKSISSYLFKKNKNKIDIKNIKNNNTS
jgi:hypothetical protein